MLISLLNKKYFPTSWNDVKKVKDYIYKDKLFIMDIGLSNGLQVKISEYSSSSKWIKEFAI